MKEVSGLRPQYHTHVRAAMATQLRASPERYRPRALSRKAQSCVVYTSYRISIV